MQRQEKTKARNPEGITNHDQQRAPAPHPREGRPPRRIDHCFVTTDLADRVAGMTIGEDAVGSDHQPIFVSLTTQVR